MLTSHNLPSFSRNLIFDFPADWIGDTNLVIWAQQAATRRQSLGWGQSIRGRLGTPRTGMTPGGKQLQTAMPCKYVDQLTGDELKAAWLFLQSLPALPRVNQGRTVKPLETFKWNGRR